VVGLEDRTWSDLTPTAVTLRGADRRGTGAALRPAGPVARANLSATERRTCKFCSNT